MLGCTKRIVLPTAIARRDSVMSASAGQCATAARAALLANFPDVHVIASGLAGAEPSSGVAREEIDINRVAAQLSAELGATRAKNVTRRAPSTATEAANRVAAARLALAEAEKYQEDLDASSMFAALKCPLPRAVSDGSLPSAYKELAVPTGFRCVFPVVPDSMEDLLDFSCLYPFQVVDSHSSDLTAPLYGLWCVSVSLGTNFSCLETVVSAKHYFPCCARDGAFV